MTYPLPSEKLTENRHATAARAITPGQNAYLPRYPHQTHRAFDAWTPTWAPPKHPRAFVEATKAKQNEDNDVQWVAPPGVQVIDVYTDGSLRNGKAGYGIHWPHGWHGLKDVSARVPGKQQTPDRAELMAIVEALRLCTDMRSYQIRIFTDCKYCIFVHQRGQHKYRAQGWLNRKAQSVGRATMRRNRDLIERLEYEMQQFKHRPALEFVKGHSGVLGNVIADRLAGQATLLPDIPPEQCVDLDAPPSFNNDVVFVSWSLKRPSPPSSSHVRFIDKSATSDATEGGIGIVNIEGK